ncbi:gliding motility lipoprotein GldB [Winogradskyella arenosi]|uniref:Protein involved in gliding motility GldB n=1 Tax=Winogradskyella arenosi TaxID=533325 RepID=A0A368ZLU1_9FLAO|nr:gliding motility lipoprotein GldB [Winogradskyella arenosi]RCW94097.1 protein involved in gliding motility GldB [Winogradskyella arenosi]
MKVRIYIILCLAFTFMACEEESKVEAAIANIEVDFKVERFDTDFYKAKAEDLPQLKTDYPFLFSKRIPDSVWVEQLNDTLHDEILTEVNRKYANFDKTSSELKSLFQHLKYYDPVFSVPRVVTLTNYVQYRDKVVVTDTIALIALDNYLGEDHRFYRDGNIPLYLSKNFRQEQIVVDLAEAYAEKYTFQQQRKFLLDEMIYYGKLLYFKDKMIPFKSDAEKIGYTNDQLGWAEANESPMWSYFIEKELLYNTDNKLLSRFITDAPFSKFYLELDNESPGQVGQYIGWQIVRAYADATGEDLMTILQKEPEEIFTKSKFKPKK